MSDARDPHDDGQAPDDMHVSVDDRRALWALTTRHLRSRTFAAVLLVRAALRANAERVELGTKGDNLRVVDDGAPRGEELTAIVRALRAPEVHALHALESRFGTDLLVAAATAQAATLHSQGRRVVVEAGVVVVDELTGSSDARTTIELRRPRNLRKEERRELSAWLPGPRAVVVVDGKRWRRSLALPEGAFSARSFRVDGGRGLIGFALQDATSKLTVTARGLWVAQDTRRAGGLPVIAFWDDDDTSLTPDAALARARAAVDKASAALLRRVADDFAHLPRGRRVQLRSLLVRGAKSGTLPPAFDDVPLFDDERGPFRRSLAELRMFAQQSQRRLIAGPRSGDVVVDAEAAAFLHRALPGLVKDALPPPRRRLVLVLRQVLGLR